MTLSLIKKYKIYLHIRSFFNYYLKRDLKVIFLFLKINNLTFFKRRVIYLPSSLKKFSVVRSPFVSKLSKEQFEIKVYRILIILDYELSLFARFIRERC
jgi:ribosomal protein S10